MTPYTSWFSAGFVDLVSVVPPGAPLSERTKLRLEDRGKVPGLLGRHGWYGFDWMKHKATAEDVMKWQQDGANLGLRATKFPGLDIDVTDRELRDLVQGLADHRLGAAPARTGRAPKLLLVYRLAEGQAPMVRRRLWFRGPDGRKHLVELLGHGQQYVVAGTHPITRRPYTWDRDPAELGAADLSPVTHAMLDEFFAELRDLLECVGGCTDIEEEGSGDEVTDREAIVQEGLQAPSLDVLADAVSRVPNDNATFPSRTDYLRMGCAIKAAGAEDPDRAMEVWQEWAGRWEGNDEHAGNDPDEVISDWERMKPPFEVGWGYVRDVAQEHGFPVAAGEFDDLPDDEPEEPGKRRLYAVWANDIPDDFQADDFVEGLLADGQASVVYGESNTGKTFFVSDLGLHIALGWKWRGLEVDQGAVVYVAAEGGLGIRRRIAAFRKAYGLEGVEIPFAIVPCSIDLRASPRDTKELIRLISEAATKTGMRVRLVVIDTLARALAGGNENASEDMGAYIQAVDRIRERTGAHTMTIHHSGKDGSKGARGHSSLRGAVDTEIEITRDTASKVARATVTKQRDMDASGVFPFHLEAVELGTNRRGKPITSCVVRPAEEGSAVRKALPGNYGTAFEMLKALIAESGRDAPTGVPAVERDVVTLDAWRDLLRDRGVLDGTDPNHRKVWQRIREKLIGAKYIEVWQTYVWLA